MNIKRFFGKNSREALTLVRQALGDSAVILSNRAINGGNEIMAFKEEDMASVLSRQESSPGTIEDSRTTTLEALFRKRLQTGQSNADTAQIDKVVESTEDPNLAELSMQTEAKEQAQDSNLQIADMLNEFRSMRSVIESQLTEISWGAIQHRDPIKSSLLSKFLSAGFSASLSKQLAENLPEKQSESDAIKWAQSILARNLSTIAKEDEILDQGGVFALIGPTGVGKTTTTAKFAARYVMKHGTQKLGLITTDAYRIGGHEQLRIYGKILGVMVHAVKDEADLKIALNELKNKHTILIDTVGVSQRDRMVAEQISMLSGTNTNIKKLLCLNATNTGETLIDVINAYKGRGLDGCLITKMDEAVTIGSVLDVIIREKLKLYYVSNGQRVPEDLHLANKQLLIHHALKLGSAKNGPFQFRNEHLPFVMGNTVHSSTKPALMEINHV